MILLIPFNPKVSSDQSFTVDIGGSVVSFRMLWNGRDQAWYMDLTSNFGTARSVKLVPNSPLLEGKADMGINGDFYVIRKDAQAPSTIGFFDLGATWGLYWLDQGAINGL